MGDCYVIFPRLEKMSENFKNMRNVESYQKEHYQDGKVTIEFGDKYPYLKLDLNKAPIDIAREMIEGYNYPGVTKPIVMASPHFPEGWEKSVIQRRSGVAEGK